MDVRKLIQFTRFYLDFAGWKFYVLQCLELLNNATKGFGILMILPLLSLAGYTENQLGSEPMVQLIGWIDRSGIEITIYGILILYLGANILLALSTFVQSLMEIRLHQGFLRQIRTQMYARMVRCEWKYLVRQKQGNLTFTSTTDIQQVHFAGIQLLRSIKSAIQILIGIVLCTFISGKLTLLACATGSVYIIIHLYFSRRTFSTSDLHRNAFQQLFGEVAESLNGLKLIKGHAHEEAKIDAFRCRSEELENQIVAVQKLINQQSLFQTITIALLITIYTFIALQYMNIEGTILALFIVVLYRISATVKGMVVQSDLLIKALPSFIAYRRNTEDMISNREYENPDESENTIPCRKHITLEEVDFSYAGIPDKPALRGINLVIEANKTTLIKGQSGSGKTTLVDLIMGLLTPVKGTIRVDGELIEGESRRFWRRGVAYVPQDSFLNHDSIRNNLLAFCPSASEEEIIQSLKTTRAYEFVTKLPEKLDSIVGDRGACLSGGERQRIALARALLRKPQLLILDEATSNLDSNTTQSIHEAIEALHGKTTILIISHHPSVVSNIDKTVVLENGHILS